MCIRDRLRDEALCRRYYYWTEVQRLRFDDALTVLSRQEFFISEERIMSIKMCIRDSPPPDRSLQRPVENYRIGFRPFPEPVLMVVGLKLNLIS